MERYGVEVEERPGGVRVLTLCNEDKRNALNPELIEALAKALTAAEAPEVRALLLRGAGGKAFCSGYDVGTLELPAAMGDRLPDERLLEVVGQLERLPAPTVALVEGAAFGAGCDLAAACDFRVGTHQTVFCMPPAKLGIVYAPEGLARLVALCGRSRAKRIFLTGCRVDAATALEWGLLDDIHAPTHAAVAADTLCDELAAGAPLAVRGMKREFDALGRLSVTGPELRELRRAAYLSEDAREGRAAFLEKRTPRFVGR